MPCKSFDHEVPSVSYNGMMFTYDGVFPKSTLESLLTLRHAFVQFANQAKKRVLPWPGSYGMKIQEISKGDEHTGIYITIYCQTFNQDNSFETLGFYCTTGG